MNHFYVCHLDLLELFIQHYHNQLQHTKGARSAYEIKLTLHPPDRLPFPLSDSQTMIARKNQFIQACQPSKFILDSSKYLTKREIEILHWLHQSKTLEETAMILEISSSTINKYIANIKSKMHADTLFKLGEEYALKFKLISEVTS